MKIISYTLIALIYMGSNVFAQTQLKDLPAESYFDFWIGEWDLIWESSNNKGFGKNIISKTLNGNVIEENFKVLNDPSMKGYLGKSWSVYNKTKGIWYQTWVDNQGAYLDFIGEFDEDKRIFKREVFKPDGTKILQRMVFYDIQQNSFNWDWESSKDDGKTWTILWGIKYKRKGS